MRPIVFWVSVGCLLLTAGVFFGFSSFHAQAISSSYQFNQNLTIGSSGSDVTALQQFLIDKGLLTSISAPTGYFGSGTKGALSKFQSANGISPASGYCGSVTRKLLNSSDISSSASQSTSIGNNQSSQTISSSLINQIEPAIVVVACFSPDSSTSDYGSGVSVNYGGTTYIETNYHVYNGANTGGGLPTCVVAYPEPPNFSYNSQYGVYNLNLYGHNYDAATAEDVADFTLGTPYSTTTPLSSIPVINDTSLTGIGSGCSDVNVGDNVTVFGYPAAGNLMGLSETVTQGTIAGIQTGPIYKFNGTIDHGNSGGLAVLDKSSCVLGIPTLGESGLTGGIGYIQSVGLARKTIAKSNDQICQDQYGGNSDYTGTQNSQGGLICGCASGYVWNTGNTACVAIPKTNNQLCQDSYGAYSEWSGQTNDNGPTCACQAGYQWNSNQTACVVQQTGYQACIDDVPNSTWEGGYNSDGSYSCTCNYGYYSNGSRCVSIY